MEHVESEMFEIMRDRPLKRVLPTVEELTAQIEGDVLCFKGKDHGPDAA
jgi:hypothetical protein